MPKINNEMLSLARQLRQMTQGEASSRTEISQGILSKAENGLRELSEEALLRISLVYNFPLSFFYRTSDISPVSHLYFRRKLTMTSKVIDSFVAKSRIIKMALDDLFKAVELPSYDLETYNPTESSPQDIANKVRYKLKVYRGPITDLITLLEKHGIIIFKMDFGTDRIDGLSSVTNGGYKVIFLNSSMPNDRIRYSLAHELGHMIMHMETPPFSIEEAELQADEFASQFLMPEDDIKPMLYNLKMSTLGELKRKWNVSMRALIRRARDLHTISQETYRYFQMDFSRKRYNKSEPIPLPSEMPSLIKNTIAIYKNELNYNDSDVAKVMKISKEDYMEWFMPRNDKNRPILRVV